MRLNQLLGEQHVRSAEEWNRVIDNSISFQDQKVTDSQLLAAKQAWYVRPEVQSQAQGFSADDLASISAGNPEDKPLVNSSKESRVFAISSC